MKFISLDIDGVVADFTGGVRREFLERSGVDIFKGRLVGGYPTQWNCFDHLDTKQRMLLEQVMGTYDFWSSLEGFPEGQKLLNLAVSDKVHSTFVTNRPKLLPVIHATEEWLADANGPLYTHQRVIFAHNKGLVAKALQFDAHLDDNYEVAYDIVTHSSTRSYLLRRPYNTRDTVHAHIRYVETIDEFLKAEGL